MMTTSMIYILYLGSDINIQGITSAGNRYGRFKRTVCYKRETEVQEFHLVHRQHLARTVRVRQGRVGLGIGMYPRMADWEN